MTRKGWEKMGRWTSYGPMGISNNPQVRDRPHSILNFLWLRNRHSSWIRSPLSPGNVLWSKNKCHIACWIFGFTWWEARRGWFEGSHISESIRPNIQCQGLSANLWTRRSRAQKGLPGSFAHEANLGRDVCDFTKARRRHVQIIDRWWSHLAEGLE